MDFRIYWSRYEPISTKVGAARLANSEAFLAWSINIVAVCRVMSRPQYCLRCVVCVGRACAVGTGHCPRYIIHFGTACALWTGENVVSCLFYCVVLLDVPYNVS
jgi:hypothetical protein